MKKRIAVLLTVLMAAAAVFSPLNVAAASGTASSIRLEQMQGSVSVKNSAGKDLKASAGVRLNSGSSVSTAKASYAYMSLDSSKAAKLDASSKASVRKSGSKLELRSEKGSLMFNVRSPLNKNETMNIRTSSMVAGVRGTAGWVFNLDANTSVIYLLEGTLDVEAVDPLTGEKKQMTISGGQGVFATLDTSGKYTENGVTITIPSLGGPRTIIIREETENLHVISFEFKEEDVPGYVAVEVAADTKLQQKITELTDLSVPIIIGTAEEKLEAAEASAEEKDTEIQQALEEVTVETIDQVFESTKESSSDGGSSGNDYTPPAPSAYEVTAASYQEIVDGIAEAKNKGASEVNVTMSKDITSADSNESLSIPKNMTVNLIGGTQDSALTIINGDELQVDGTLNVAEDTAVEVAPGGTIRINSANSLHVKGVLLNDGTVYVGTEDGITTSTGALLIEDSGSFLNAQVAKISVCSGSSITVSSDASGNWMTARSLSFENYGEIEVSSGGSICLMTSSDEGTVTFVNEGTMTVNQGAEMTIAKGATLTNSAIITSSGIIDNQGTLVNEDTITNNGTMTNGGIITNNGTISNNGSFTNNKTITFSEEILDSAPSIQNNSEFTISEGASMTVNGNGQFTNGGNVTNSGIITITSSGIVTNTSKFTNDGNIENNRKIINNGLFTNDKIITTNYDITNNGTFTNNGTITNNHIITNNNEIINNAIITVAWQGYVGNGGVINNYCKLNFEGEDRTDRQILMLSGDGTINIYNQGTMTLQGNSYCTINGPINVVDGTLMVHGSVYLRKPNKIQFETGEYSLYEKDEEVVISHPNIYNAVSGNATLRNQNDTDGAIAITLSSIGILQCEKCYYDVQSAAS